VSYIGTDEAGLPIVVVMEELDEKDAGGSKFRARKVLIITQKVSIGELRQRTDLNVGAGPVPATSGQVFEQRALASAAT
jgi:hypothetical protein